MLKIYIVRHGETVYNKEKKLQGWVDSPLTELGIAQAEALSHKLSDIEFDSIYTSTLKRTIKTAEIIMKQDSSTFIRVDDLKEIGFGKWEGSSMEKMRIVNQKQYDAFWTNPEKYEPEDGESFFDLQERVLAGINELQKKHAKGNILLVTHAIVIKILLCHFKGISLTQLWETPYIHSTSLTVIEIDRHRITVAMCASVDHLAYDIPISFAK